MQDFFHSLFTKLNHFSPLDNFLTSLTLSIALTPSITLSAFFAPVAAFSSPTPKNKLAIFIAILSKYLDAVYGFPLITSELKSALISSHMHQCYKRISYNLYNS